MEINVNFHKSSRLPKQLAILGDSFSASKNLTTQIFDTFSILFPSHVTSTANAFYSVLLATFFFGAIFDANFFSLLMDFFFFLMVFIGKGKSCNKNKTRQLLVIDQCAIKIANYLLTVFLVVLFTPVNSFFLPSLGFLPVALGFDWAFGFLPLIAFFPLPPDVTGDVTFGFFFILAMYLSTRISRSKINVLFSFNASPTESLFSKQTYAIPLHPLSHCSVRMYRSSPQHSNVFRNISSVTAEKELSKEMAQDFDRTLILSSSFNQ